ncbi:MAG: hypothetical protein IPJ21_17455 [Sterolibacteriaceae bacterium]|nr:hypothetical protein [Sterolibacteriaceae bacterium]
MARYSPVAGVASVHWNTPPTRAVQSAKLCNTPKLIFCKSPSGWCSPASGLPSDTPLVVHAA